MIVPHIRIQLTSDVNCYLTLSGEMWTSVHSLKTRHWPNCKKRFNKNQRWVNGVTYEKWLHIDNSITEKPIPTWVTHESFKPRALRACGQCKCPRNLPTTWPVDFLLPAVEYWYYRAGGGHVRISQVSTFSDLSFTSSLMEECFNWKKMVVQHKFCNCCSCNMSGCLKYGWWFWKSSFYIFPHFHEYWLKYLCAAGHVLSKPQSSQKGLGQSALNFKCILWRPW